MKLMWRAKSIRPRSILWVLLNTALLVGLIVRWSMGTNVDSILHAAPKKVVLPTIDFQVPQLAVSFDVIQSQPLFHESRQFYVPPDPTLVAAQLMPPDYHFVGAMTLPKQSPIALLVHNQTGARTKVQRGDQLDGWKVEAVDNKHVKLSLDGHEAELGASVPGVAVAQNAIGPATPVMTQGITQGVTQGLTHVPAMHTDAPASGVRVLSGGATRAYSSATPLPPAPPGGVGARLYRPPPGQ
jgi:hypothetical protein